MQAKLISTKEAASILGIPRAKVNELIRNGRLRAIKCNSQYVIDEGDLDNVKIRKSGRPKKV